MLRGRVTQWIECQIPDLMVVGSIPAMPSEEKKNLLKKVLMYSL